MGAIVNSPADAAFNCGSNAIDGPGAPRNFTMFALILNQMEQTSSFNAINFNLAAMGSTYLNVDAGSANTTGLRPSVSSYICPSDFVRTFHFASNPSGNGSFAVPQTSYFASGGTWNIVAYFAGPACWQQDPGNGAFDDYSAYGISTFTDGTSNTIAVGESSRFKNDPDWFANGWSPYGYVPSFADPSGNTSRAQGFAFEVPRINANLYIGDVPLLPPGNTQNTDYKNWLLNIPLYKEFGQWGFRSQHPGGANFLFCDGSAKFLKETINLATYQGLGTRNQGEVLSADSY
jgi:prepilin-type processing-associated H-X9-DG protein